MKRIFKSPEYNHIFDMVNGNFIYWGTSLEENPTHCPYGPSILDIEIASGECIGCSFCYKGNDPSAEKTYMSLSTFEKILDKINKEVLTQIAFGITNIDSNPDLWQIFEHCRKHNIIPNYTCNGLGITTEIAQQTASLCGAVAVSLVTQDSYNAVERFIAAGIKQTNIHFMISEETYEKAFTVIDDIKTDPRLANLNAIVFLQYKPKGHGIGLYNPIATPEKYKTLIDYAKNNKVGLGFDSCSAPLYLKAIEKEPDFNAQAMYAEPCESSLFSGYINVHGEFFPCSFVEGLVEGIDVLQFKSFEEVWNHPLVINWRDRLLLSSQKCNCTCKQHCRCCFMYPTITSCRDMSL